MNGFDNLQVTVKVPRQRISQAPPQSPAPATSPRIAVFPIDAKEVIQSAYASAVSWKCLTPFFENYEKDRAAAENQFRETLSKLQEARERALAIIATMKCT